MRKLLIAILVLCISHLIFAQANEKKSPKSFKHEFGINGTKLLSNLFSLSNEAVSTRYVGTYSYKPSKNIGVRTFLGGNLESSNADNAIKSSTYQINGKLGIEYIKTKNQTT